jgi:hypothetical protein
LPVCVKVAAAAKDSDEIIVEIALFGFATT